jgi:hypothetical protein
MLTWVMNISKEFIYKCKNQKIKTKQARKKKRKKIRTKLLKISTKTEENFSKLSLKIQIFKP